MKLDRQTGESAKQHRAMLLWVMQPPSRRSGQAVADEIGVVGPTITKWKAKHCWQQRLKHRKAARDMYEQLYSDGAEDPGISMRRHLRLLDASLFAVAQGLKEGTVKVSPRDLPLLLDFRAKLERQISAKETESLSARMDRLEYLATALDGCHGDIEAARASGSFQALAALQRQALALRSELDQAVADAKAEEAEAMSPEELVNDLVSAVRMLPMEHVERIAAAAHTRIHGAPPLKVVPG